MKQHARWPRCDISKGALCALFMALAGSAHAADAPAPLSSIQLTPVALPIVVDDRVVNYVFVTVKLQLEPGADGAAVRAKEPFFRDALVRAGHRAPFTLSTDYSHVDAARVRTEVMNEAIAIVGRGMVHNVIITKQVAQHHVNMASALPSNSGPELIP
jgi:hypothetical protein